ncbi:hypothetical protein [Planosporangium thailandense]|uniref:hypothetical protein n=1 Tax=Planosporangium thailandense TaxID=765197 RepID=UPI003B832EAD
MANGATWVLLKRAPQAIDAVGDAVGGAFVLTAGERRLLLSARVGHGLLIPGTNRTAFESISLRAGNLEFVASRDDFWLNSRKETHVFSPSVLIIWTGVVARGARGGLRPSC